MTATMAYILAVWFGALLVGVPLFASMGLAAFAFVWMAGIPAGIIPQKIAQSANSFPLLAAPLFILMGNIMNSAGITDRIFAFATACVGWLRGGLCHANILASVIFAGMSGSAVADAGGVGTLEIKAMKDEGYDPETAAAITAASATIGPIIPPSLPMVIYGVSADVSIGGLFLAGIVPGLLMAGALMIMVTEVARRRNMPRHPFPGTRELWIAYKRAHWALMTPVILFGGMVAGLFTPTEAAGVATVYALILGLFVYKDFDLAKLPDIIVDTVETTGVVLALVMTAAALGWCLSISRIPQTVGPMIVDLVGNPLMFLLAVNVLLLVVGCFMEALAAMLILIA
jgi:tripartite ATP-independent transporter DctM subunit